MGYFKGCQRQGDRRRRWGFYFGNAPFPPSGKDQATISTREQAGIDLASSKGANKEIGTSNSSKGVMTIAFAKGCVGILGTFRHQRSLDACAN